jgi:hypothetical protein
MVFWQVALLFSALAKLEGCLAPLELHLFSHTLAVFRQISSVDAGFLISSALSAKCLLSVSWESSLPFGVVTSLPLFFSKNEFYSVKNISIL